MSILLTIALVGVLMNSVALSYRRSLRQHVYPVAFEQFWIVAGKDGSLIPVKSIDEEDPSIRAWCYARAYRDRPRPHHLWLPLYERRFVRVWIDPVVDESIDWYDHRERMSGVLGNAARDWVENSPTLSRFTDDFRGQRPEWGDRAALDLPGVMLSALIWGTGIALLFKAAFALQRRAERRSAPALLAAGLCPACRYNISGSSSLVCPECGRPLPPRDPPPSA